MSNAAIVLDLFEKALEINRAQEEAEYLESHPDGKTNPSVSDFLSCPRKVWYSLKGIEETNPPDAQSLANFFFGHAIEEAVAQLFTLLGLEVKREIRVVLGVTSGRLDFLLEIPDLNVVIELKTTKTRQVNYLPQEPHVHQNNGYLHAMALQGKRYDGVLAYIVKDATRGRKTMYTFDVPYDAVMAEQDLEMNQAIYDLAAHTDIPPARPAGYTMKKFPCSYCPFMTRCWQ